MLKEWDLGCRWHETSIVLRCQPVIPALAIYQESSSPAASTIDPVSVAAGAKRAGMDLDRQILRVATAKVLRQAARRRGSPARGPL
jgi:hypothetical protein